LSKKEKNMKDKPIQIRVSISEKKAFQDAAKITGVSLSGWIRSNLRKAAIKDLEEVGQLAEFLKKGEISNG
jgi:uncharacterized protein (DUF1778 family)